MHDPEQQPDAVDDVLARARRHVSPSTAQAERVLHATLSQIALTSVAAEPASPSPGLPAHTLMGGAHLLRQVVAASLIAASSGVTGYVLGKHAAETHEVAPAQRSAVSAQTSPPSALPAPAPVALPALAEPEPVELARAPARARRRHELASVGAPETVDTSTLALTLSEELAAMKRVERALREHHYDVALALLDELDRRATSGSLREERDAASVMARCNMGLGRRASLAESFVVSHPESAYRARVELACRARDRE